MDTAKILIVDDDPTILDLLQHYISHFGLEYATATDGLDAVEKLRDDEFTIVLTDIMMPRMNGMELLNHIRDHYPAIAVIMVTGFTRDFTFTNVIKAGASDFISKPFNTDELEAKIKRVIREQNIIRKLERHSNYDALTDLYNRRHFDTIIKQEAQRADRQSYEIFLLFLDVDNFKAYNDQFGHQAGDCLLQNLGKLLQLCIRENVDWAFRFGGDEFLVILTQLNRQQALATAQRIVKRYDECDYTGTHLSIGIARFVRNKDVTWHDNIEDLVARADKALYQAKKQPASQIRMDNK